MCEKGLDSIFGAKQEEKVTRKRIPQEKKISTDSFTKGQGVNMWTNIGKISQIPVDKTIFHDIIIQV